MNGHVSVLFAAQLLTLTVEIAHAFSTEPSVANEARNGVLLDAQGWHSECVNHVVCSCDDTDFFANRHNQSVVDFQEVVVTSRLACIGHFTVRIV